MTHHRHVDHMTRNEIYHHIKRSGCRMLAGLKLNLMTKEQMIAHLEKAQCPELKKLMTRQRSGSVSSGDSLGK